MGTHHPAHVTQQPCIAVLCSHSEQMAGLVWASARWARAIVLPLRFLIVRLSPASPRPEQTADIPDVDLSKVGAHRFGSFEVEVVDYTADYFATLKASGGLLGGLQRCCCPTMMG